MEKHYFYEVKGVSGNACINNNKFYVLEGSHAVGNHLLSSSFKDESRAENESRRQLRQKLLAEGTLRPSGQQFVFTKNVEFNSSSEAATIIAGNSWSGVKLFNEQNTEYYDFDDERAIEGYKHDRILSVSARSRDLVDKCKERDGYQCKACGFKLSVNKTYVIECHHMNPLSINGERTTNLKDIISLCPTCHRIAHLRMPPYTVEEVREKIAGT